MCIPNHSTKFQNFQSRFNKNKEITNNLDDMNLKNEMIYIVDIPATAGDATLSAFLGLKTLAGYPLDAVDAPALIMKENSVFKVLHRGFGTRRSVYMVEETCYCQVDGPQRHIWIIYERLPRLANVESRRTAILVELERHCCRIGQ
ncbi:uncharacterized protein LOC112600715 [Melanaphis sacchari]|uniref:uncharacterized protein LOC112600715 n=1 Tax=Melanaphis sacchari TaxID=742174 RepID=UPI000DC138B8|nr:uncharacterized protein LOC112600715 [Melanaphis sacchari]